MRLRISTRLATDTLEIAEILPIEAHPHPQLERVAVAMYRSSSWTWVPECIPGEARGYIIRNNHPLRKRALVNDCAGELEWR